MTIYLGAFSPIIAPQTGEGANGLAINQPSSGEASEQGDIAALARVDAPMWQASRYALCRAHPVPCFIAGRIYGADVLGRFAHAVICRRVLRRRSRP